jgi:hypothetical protein
MINCQFLAHAVLSTDEILDRLHPVAAPDAPPASTP